MLSSQTSPPLSAPRISFLSSQEGHSGSVNALAILPDGRLASASDDKAIKLWNTNKLWDTKIPRCLGILQGHSNIVYTLATLPDGRLVSGSDDGTIKFWDTKTAQCLLTLQADPYGVFVLIVLPDGRLASGLMSNVIKLWDTKTGECLLTLKKHSVCDFGYISALTILPDGRLASGSSRDPRGEIRFWETKTGQYLATLEEDMGEILSLVVLPDGRLVSGSKDGTIKFWDTKTGQCLATLQEKNMVDNIRSLCILPNGDLLSGSANYIKHWDTKTGQCISTLITWGANALIMLPDGSFASGNGMRLISFWQAFRASMAFPTLEFAAKEAQQLDRQVQSFEQEKQQLDAAIQQLNLQISSLTLLQRFSIIQQTNNVRNQAGNLLENMNRVLQVLNTLAQQLDVRDLQQQCSLLISKTNSTIMPRLMTKIDGLQEFKQAIDNKNYEDAKLCLEQGLPIDSFINLNGQNRSLFEYAAIKQSKDMEFAALVLYFDRRENSQPIIPYSTIEAVGRQIRGVDNAGGYIRDLLKSYQMVISSLGTLAPLSPTKRLLDVTHALTTEHQKSFVKAQFETFYDEFFNRPDFKIIIKLAALSTHGIHKQAQKSTAMNLWEKQFKVFADPNSIYIDGVYFKVDKNKILERETVGLQTCNHVFLGVKIIKEKPREISATLIHEITHFIALEVYDNAWNPYQKSDANASALFDRIYKHIKNSNQNKTEFISIFNGKYKPSDHHNEIIARTAEYLWNRSNHQTAKQDLQKLCPELHDFYFNKFLPDCDKHYWELMGGYTQNKTNQQVKMTNSLAKLNKEMENCQSNPSRQSALTVEKQLLTIEKQKLDDSIQDDKRDSDLTNKVREEELQRKIDQLERKNEELERENEKLKKIKLNELISTRNTLAPPSTSSLNPQNIGVEESDAIRTLSSLNVQWEISCTNLEVKVKIPVGTTVHVKMPLTALRNFIKKISEHLKPDEQLEITVQFEERALLIQCKKPHQVNEYQNVLIDVLQKKLTSAPTPGKVTKISASKM